MDKGAWKATHTAVWVDLENSAVCNQKENAVGFEPNAKHVTSNTCTQHHDSFKAPSKDQKVGGGPIPGNLHPFPKTAGTILPLIAIP